MADQRQGGRGPTCYALPSDERAKRSAAERTLGGKAAFVVTIFGFLVVACASNAATTMDADSGAGAQRSACSTGPAYDYRSQFPDEPGATSVSTEPECTPRCGTGRRAGATVNPFSIEALPSGACSVEGELCAMAAQATCPCPNEQAPSNVYRCRCSGASWTCSIIQAGGSICTNQCAGADAGK